MFHFYYEKLIKNCTDANGNIDFNKCSDYIISKDLGITQQKVKNLKIMNQLLFPNSRSWKDDFCQLISNATYEQSTNRIILNSPDPNLFLEIQNYIEENGGFIEKQLNGKLLQIKPEYFLQLVINEETENHKQQIIKQIKDIFKSHNKSDKTFNEKNIGKSLLDLGVGITSILSSIIDIFSPANILGKAFSQFVKNKLL